jgi:hypothetical protein
MILPWEAIASLFLKGISILRTRPRVAVETKLVFEDGGGSSNVGGTVWNLWKDLYVDICVTNAGTPTTIKRAYVSIRNKKREVLRFSPWKSLEYINYKDLTKSPELDKTLQGTRLETNDSWGPHIVLFSGQEIVTGKNAQLPDGNQNLLVIEVVGQRPVLVKL